MSIGRRGVGGRGRGRAGRPHLNRDHEMVADPHTDCEIYDLSTESEGSECPISPDQVQRASTELFTGLGVKENQVDLLPDDFPPLNAGAEKIAQNSGLPLSQTKSSGRWAQMVAEEEEEQVRKNEGVKVRQPANFRLEFEPSVVASDKVEISMEDFMRVRRSGHTHLLVVSWG